MAAIPFFSGSGLKPRAPGLFMESDRPIAEMLAPRLVPLSHAFNAKFIGMTLVPIKVEALEASRTKLVSDLHAMLTDVSDFRLAER